MDTYFATDAPSFTADETGAQGRVQYQRPGEVHGFDIGDHPTYSGEGISYDPETSHLTGEFSLEFAASESDPTVVAWGHLSVDSEVPRPILVE